MQWDTAGSERFRTLTSTYYKQADAVFIVCDQTSQESFDEVKSYWLKEVREHSEPHAILVLLLNKMDAHNKELNPDDVSRFAETEGIAMYETSAKTGKNVTGVFTEICRKLISQRDQ